MKIHRFGLGGLALSLALGFWACSSDDSSNTGNTGGSSGASGGGTSASNGSGGAGGSQNAAGDSSGAGGASGSSSGGAGASVAGSGGASTDASTKSDAPVSGDAATGVDGGPFTLTSTAYAEGMAIPAVHTCAGTNTSPPLAWSGAPSATKSFALVFTDKDNNPGAGGFIHWVLWDIAPTTTSLPAAIAAGAPAGSKGSSFNGNPGYAGPCPGGNLHHYIFELYPLDVATLPNEANNADRPGLVTAIKAHQVVAPASLIGTSNAMR